METERIPWLFAIITAGWCGWMAKRAGRTSTLWAVAGAAFGLVTSAIVLGLGQARSISFSDHDRAVQQTKWIIASAMFILIVGWLLTSSLHRHHLLIWRKFNPDPGPAQPSATPTKVNPTPATKSLPDKSQT